MLCKIVINQEPLTTAKRHIEDLQSFSKHICSVEIIYIFLSYNFSLGMNIVMCLYSKRINRTKLWEQSGVVITLLYSEYHGIFFVTKMYNPG